MSEATARETPGISIRHLYKIFGAAPEQHLDRVRAGLSKAELMAAHGHVLGLNDINLDMAAGRIQVIMGLSGSGKSTLIRHINRLIDPTAGEVVVGGEDVVKMAPAELRTFRRHQTAMVFQKFALLPNRTVLENTGYGLEIQGVPRAQRRAVSMRWIERVGLSGFEGKYPNELSGGMQQRVGLARALANDAPILLMDEAFSALDPLIRMDMQGVLLDLQAEIRKTVVFITHDLDEALRLGDSIAILRDGALVQVGSSQDIVLRPADAYIESFVREVNRARVVQVAAALRPLAEGEDVPRLSVPQGITLDEAMKLMAAEGRERLALLDDAGALVGVASRSTVIAAMAGAAEGQTPDAAMAAVAAPA